MGLQEQAAGGVDLFQGSMEVKASAPGAQIRQQPLRDPSTWSPKVKVNLGVLTVTKNSVEDKS